MNHKAFARRIRELEDIYGPCRCDSYGTCPLCVMLTDHTATTNAAATGPFSVYENRGDDPDLTASAGRQVSFTFVDRDE